MNIDELTTKVATERGQVTVASQLGVKLANAEQMIEQVRSLAFFEELANHGLVTKTAQEQQELVDFANQAVQWVQQIADSQDGSSEQFSKHAAESVVGELDRIGGDTQEQEQASLAFAANYIKEAGVIEHTLAYMDAQELLAAE